MGAASPEYRCRHCGYRSGDVGEFSKPRRITPTSCKRCDARRAKAYRLRTGYRSSRPSRAIRHACANRNARRALERALRYRILDYEIAYQFGCALTATANRSRRDPVRAALAGAAYLMTQGRAADLAAHVGPGLDELLATFQALYGRDPVFTERVRKGLARHRARIAALRLSPSPHGDIVAMERLEDELARLKEEERAWALRSA